ncbi:hypothetical protein ALC62_06871 [Cyphomyrmex costatus]|uniref:Uncharacterized protein n=1 Tax=Cyphomyrmex costatus TaxID=456900 RepID=A0A151IIS7_9HYME|nr:hypothetical protein ALC62_06871 [Cyphomyrmex costatus]
MKLAHADRLFYVRLFAQDEPRCAARRGILPILRAHASSRLASPHPIREDAWEEVCSNEKDLSVRGKEKKGGREGWSLKAWASRNSDVAFGLETTRTSGSCSLGGHDWPVCYHMGFAVTTKYLKPHRAVRIAFLDSSSSFASENVASLRRRRRMRMGYLSRSTLYNSIILFYIARSVQAGYSLNIHGCATLLRALQTSLFRTGMIIEAPIDPDHSKFSLSLSFSLAAQTLPCAETMTVAAKERRDHAL